MNLKSLLVPLVALALGLATPTTFAKGHGQAKAHKEHEKKALNKHEKKHSNENSNKQSNEESRRGSEHAEQRHHKGKPNCGKNCVKPEHSDGKSASKETHVKQAPKAVTPKVLPQLPKIDAAVPTPPKISSPNPVAPKIGFPELPKSSVPAPPAQNPVDGLIDKAAEEAKQKARETH